MLATIPAYQRARPEFMRRSTRTLMRRPDDAGNLDRGSAEVAAGHGPHQDVPGGPCSARRAESATDPAAFHAETVIILKPTSEWRRRATGYSAWAPGLLNPVLRHITPDHITSEQLVSELNAALKLPGVSNAWTMPIKGASTC
jgi:Cu(I)/Ag(I) efflux system membrane protein CusA/SilA